MGSRSGARKALERLVALGFDDLPICIAKTQSSFSDDPKRRGAPTGWTLTVTDVQLSAGTGFLVVVCGNMMLMPGLGAARRPRDGRDGGRPDHRAVLTVGPN